MVYMFTSTGRGIAGDRHPERGPIQDLSHEKTSSPRYSCGKHTKAVATFVCNEAFSKLELRITSRKEGKRFTVVGKQRETDD